MHNLKILIVINSLTGGGAERVTLNLATEWRDAGAEVIVAVLSSDKRDSYPVPQGVRIVSLNIPGRPKSILAILRNNVKPIIKIKRLLRQERPDIAIGAVSISLVGLALARTSDDVAIGHEHIHPPKGFSSVSGILFRIWNFVRQYAYTCLDSVVVLTPQSAEWIRANTRARKVVAIPNSVSLPLPDNKPIIEPKNIIPVGKKLLLAIGRLDSQKRFDRLLNAFAQIAPHHSDWHLVILGEDVSTEKKEFRAQLKAQVTRLGLTQQVSLPGFAGNVADWYRTAEVLAMTSDYEGFPMVLLEAMAHGCPPISVDCDTGPRDIIRNGENGLLVPQNDLDALVNGLDKMLSDDLLRKRLASKAIEVLEIYSPTRVNAKWQDLFDEMIRDRNVRIGKI